MISFVYNERNTLQNTLDGGVYLAPSIFEAGFVSAAHTDADIDATIAAARESFKLL